MGLVFGVDVIPERLRRLVEDHRQMRRLLSGIGLLQQLPQHVAETLRGAALHLHQLNGLSSGKHNIEVSEEAKGEQEDGADDIDDRGDEIGSQFFRDNGLNWWHRASVVRFRLHRPLSADRLPAESVSGRRLPRS